MKLNERQKLCATCDGRIPLEANLCPYCAAEQTQMYLQHKSIQESLTSLYSPLYPAKNVHPSKEQALTPSLQESMEKSFQHVSPSSQARLHDKETVSEKNQGEKASFWPILLLSLGANLLVIGLLQLFFSDQGLLTLQWESHYWYVYLLVALPLLYLGTKKLSKNTHSS